MIRPSSARLPYPSKKWHVTIDPLFQGQIVQILLNFLKIASCQARPGLPYRSTCPCFSAFRCLSSALSIGSAPTSLSPHCAPWRRFGHDPCGGDRRSTGRTGGRASTPPVEAKSAVNLATCGFQTFKTQSYFRRFPQNIA